MVELTKLSKFTISKVSEVSTFPWVSEGAVSNGTLNILAFPIFMISETVDLELAEAKFVELTNVFLSHFQRCCLFKRLMTTADTGKCIAFSNFTYSDSVSLRYSGPKIYRSYFCIICFTSVVKILNQKSVAFYPIFIGCCG